MAGNIKGITIEFRGETTKLGKAMRTIKKESRSVDSELEKVNQALKFNPGNTELIAQKQSLLKQKIKSTEQALSELKNAQKQLDAKGVDKTSAEYQSLRREIIETESKLKTFNRELKKVKSPSLIHASEEFKRFGSTLTHIGRNATITGAALIALGSKFVSAAIKAQQSQTKLEEVMKSMMGASKKQVAEINKVIDAEAKTGVVGKTAQRSGAQQLATYLHSTKALKKLTPAMNDLAVQMHGTNVTQEDMVNTANMFGKVYSGQVGALRRAGVSFDKAQEQVLRYGNEEEKAAMLAQVISQNVGNMNQKMAETPSGQLAQARNQIAGMSSQIGATLLPALGKLAAWVSANILPKVQSLINFLQAHPVMAKIAIGITAVLAVGGPLIVMIGAVVSAIGVLLPVIGAISLPMIAIVAAIAAVIAAGVALYTHWAQVKARAAQEWNAIKSDAVKIWNAIKSAIVSPIMTAYATVKAVINKIKSVFNAIKLKLDLKLPHISLHGGSAPFGIGGKGSLPKFDVKWYKTGGIFNNASVIGVGEAGTEAVVPLDKLWSQMDNMFEKNNSQQAIMLGQIVQLMKEMIYISQQPTRIKMNDREFGRLINSVT
nr:MAG TPA: minor tail protein [Caudoviricetes sp.]